MSDTIEKNSTGLTTEEEFWALITKLADYMYDTDSEEPLTSEESVRLRQMLKDPSPSLIRDIEPYPQTVGEERKNEMHCLLKAYKDVAEGRGPTEEQIAAAYLMFEQMLNEERTS